MREDISHFLHAEQVLNATILRGTNTLLPLEGFNFRLVEQSRERNKGTYTPYQHQHTYFELHMPISGSQCYLMDDDIVTLTPYEIIMLAPNTMHAISDSSKDLQKFSASFILLEDHLSSDFAWVYKELCNRKYLTARADEWYGSLFFRMFREANLAQPGWSTLVINMLSQLIIDTVRENLHAEMTRNGTWGLQRKRIESIERFISDNISAPLTNKMVAEYMYLSIRQLDRVTMAERGMTLKALIDSMKIREARRLLIETDLDQKEISASLGFSEVSTFIRYFRRFESVSPGVYRAHAKAGTDLYLHSESSEIE